MDNDRIMKEFFSTRLSCSSAPLSGSDASNAKYLMDKISYFRQNNVPEDLLADLEMQIIVHCTGYYENNFESFLYFMKNRTIAITKAIEAISIDNYEKILRISEPALRYIEKKIAEFPDAVNIGKEHEVILFSITNDRDKPTRIIGKDWDAFLCMFIKLSLDKRYASLNTTPLDNLKRYVECALKLCPVNAEVFYFSALYYGIIGQTSKSEDLLKKALACSCSKDMLAACYITLAVYYAEKQEMKIACSLLDIASEYSNKPVAYPRMSAKMMKDRLFPMQESDYVYSEVLLKEKVQIGFSNNVNLAANLLKKNITHYMNNTFIQTVLSNSSSGVRIEQNTFIKSKYTVLLSSESKYDEKFIFNVNRVYSIGRDEDNDIVFSGDIHMARKEFEILTKDDRMFFKNYNMDKAVEFHYGGKDGTEAYTTGYMELGKTTVGVIVYKLYWAP